MEMMRKEPHEPLSHGHTVAELIARKVLVEQTGCPPATLHWLDQSKRDIADAILWAGPQVLARPP